MKTVKSLLLVACLLSTFFVVSKSQYPTYGYPITHTLVIPWNASSVTGQFPMIYGNFYSNLPSSLITSITPEGSVTQGPPNQYGLPNYLSVTVSQAGSHYIISVMNNTVIGSPFTVTKQPPPVTHGSLSCPVSRYLSAGTQSNSQTSGYISPGSNVSWSLSYNIFNQYWNNSIPTSTSATAQIGSPLNQILTATASGNYQGMQNSIPGTYTYTAGGTLTLYASVSIGSNASGGSALATISW